MVKNKSAIKRHKQSLIRRERNRSIISNLRTLVKEARQGIAAGSPDATAIATAKRALDRAASKGAMHRKTAARRISRLARSAQRATH